MSPCDKHHRAHLWFFTALAGSFFLTSTNAQESKLDPGLGSSAAVGVSSALLDATKDGAPAAPAAVVGPRTSFANARYATGGVALRNRQLGSIGISGVVPPVKRALLYWAYLFSTAPTATQAITFCKPQAGSPATFSCSGVGGVLVARGADTCWGSRGIAVYRADVTSLVAGNGIYPVRLTSAASATNNGADPWASVQFPAAEGASLVVVGTGNQTVGIYDTGLSGTTFLGSTSYTLTIPGGVRRTPVLWDNIAADGQLGTSRGFGLAKERTFINGVQISGPGVNTVTGVTDSDWDGSSGFPLPQLWDDTGHALPTTAAPVGRLSLGVQISSSGSPVDCLTPIVNVVAY